MKFYNSDPIHNNDISLHQLFNIKITKPPETCTHPTIPNLLSLFPFET